MIVSFGTFYEKYGRQTVEIPDDVDNVEKYIQDHFDDYPLPTGSDYVTGSAELDIESIIIEKE